MSRLLLEWVNEQVRLTRRVEEFADLANGYLLGELLYRFNQQHDFDKFRDSDRVQIKIDNFCLLEQAISGMGIRGFDSRAAIAIMNGESKACVDVLYSIKAALAAITVKVGRHPAEDVLPGRFEALTNFVRLSRPAFDHQKSLVFRKSISTRLRSQNQVDMEKHLQAFHDERKRQDEFVSAMARQDQQNTEMYYQEIRARNAMNRRAELEYLNGWHEKGIGIWTENQRRRRYVHDVQRRFEHKREHQALEMREKAREDSRVDTLVGIETMEGRLTEIDRKLRLVFDLPDAGDAGDDANKAFEALTSRPEQAASGANQEEEDGPSAKADGTADSEEEVAFLMSQDEALTLPRPQEDQLIEQLVATRRDIPRGNERAVKLFIEDLRKRKGTEASRQGYRERRRVKFTAGLQTKAQQALEECQIKLLRECVTRPCAGQLKLQRELEWQDRYVAVMEENRAYRSEQVYHRAEKEREAADYRKAVLEGLHQEKVEQDEAWYRERKARVAESICGAHAKRVEEMCSQLVYDMVDVSLAQANRLVVAGGSTFALAEDLAEPIARFVAGVEAAPEATDLADFLAHERTWGAQEVTEDEPLKPHAVGNYLLPLRLAACPPQEEDLAMEPAAQDVQRFKVQVAVVGQHLSGKSTVAVRLAAKFNLHVLEAEDCLARFLDATRKATRDDLDAAALADRDQTYVDAIVHAIRDLTARGIKRDEYLQQLADEGTLSSSEANAEMSDADLEDRLFRLWDADESGDLDTQELLRAAMIAHCEGKAQEDVEAEAYEAFNQMDFDLNGRVTRDEFRTYFAAVFGDRKREALESLLLHTDTLCKGFDGWVLDGFPRTRAQARLLELALTGLDADRTEYRPPACSTFPCDPPRKLDQAIFKGLGVGALDVVVDLDLPAAETFRRAARLGLSSTSRFRVVPTALQYEEHVSGVADWYRAFDCLELVDATPLTPRELFERTLAPVQAIVDRKGEREAAEQAAAAAAAWAARCQRVAEEWEEANAKVIAAPEPNGEPAEAPSDTALAAAAAVAPAPPLCEMSLAAAGIVSAATAAQTTTEPSLGSLAPVDSLDGRLLVSPEEACELGAAYRSSIPGQLFGVSNSLVKTLRAGDIAIDTDALVAHVKEAVPLPDVAPEPAPESSKQPEQSQADEASDDDVAAADNAEPQLSTVEVLFSFLTEHHAGLEQVEAAAEPEATETKGADESSNVQEGEEQPPTGPGAAEDGQDRAEAARTAAGSAALEKLVEVLREYAFKLLEEKRKELEELEKKAKKGGAAKADASAEAAEAAEDELAGPSTEVPEDMAKALVELVDARDASFVTECKAVFAKLREQRQEWVAHYSLERAYFDAVLRSTRLDAVKQAILDEFQGEVDELEEAMRFHPLTKQRLHFRLEEAARALWEQVHLKEEECTHLIQDFGASPWLKDAQHESMSQYLRLMQLQVTRYQSTRAALVLAGSKQCSGETGFGSPEQQQMYEKLWPVAALFGDSLEPSIPFGGEGKVPAGKDKGAKGAKGSKAAANTAAEPAEAEAARTADERIATALQAAKCLAAKLAEADSPAFAEHAELAEALMALDTQMCNDVARLAAKANEQFARWQALAQEQLAHYSRQVKERADAEIQAIEAFVLYASTCIEEAVPLAPARMALRGANFELLERQDQDQDQDQQEEEEEEQQDDGEA